MENNSSLPPLSDRIQLVTDELSVALRWDSVCLLVLAYRSEYIKSQVDAALEQFAASKETIIKEIRVTRKSFDVPLILRDSPVHKETIYSVSGLQWGGGRGSANAFRALNMHREYLVEGSYRCIFWTTPAEYKKMVRFSPDFWAFRHKMVDFTDLPPLPGDSLRLEGHPGEIEHTLRLLELNRSNPEAHQRLAAVYRSLGCFEDAIHHNKKVLRLTQDKSLPLCSLAEIYQILGQDELSARMRKKASRVLGAAPTTPD